MSKRTPIYPALAGGAFVGGTTFLLMGWNAVAAHAAARNTVRVSAFFYIVAMASPGLTQLVSRFAKLGGVPKKVLFPAQKALVQAFVAAHMMHFAAVALVVGVFDVGRSHNSPLAAAVKIAGGFALIAILGLTSGRMSRWQMRVNQLLFLRSFRDLSLWLNPEPVPPLAGCSLGCGVRGADLERESDCRSR